MCNYYLFKFINRFNVFFFFSSRRRHTRSLCDWSSDVCSSDLVLRSGRLEETRRHVAVEADLGVGVVVDENQVVRPRELDGALEGPLRKDRARGVVRVVEVEQIGSPDHIVGNRLEIREELVLRRQRQIVDVGAREDRARRVRRVPGRRAQRHLARVKACHRDVPDRLLAPQRRHDLRRRIELDAEAVAVEGRRRLTHLVGAVVRRILVGGGVSERFCRGLNDCRGRRHVGIADREADDVDALPSLRLHEPLELSEEVRRNRVEPLREPHRPSSSLASPLKISCAGPVRRACIESSSSTRRSPPARWTVTGLWHQPRATATPAVSPAPRSQTPTVMSPGPSTRTSWTFVRSGNRSWFSMSGPSRSKSSRSGSRRTTACGFPTEAGVNSTVSSPTSSVSGSCTSTAPMSISTSRPSRILATTLRGPTRIRTVSAPLRRASQRAAIRVPFPDSSAIEPSGFQITTSASLPSAETTSRTPSEPTPKW